MNFIKRGMLTVYQYGAAAAGFIIILIIIIMNTRIANKVSPMFTNGSQMLFADVLQVWTVVHKRFIMYIIMNQIFFHGYSPMFTTRTQRLTKNSTNVH